MPTFQEVIKAIPGLTHYYPLDDVSKANDIVGSAHGKVNGAVTFGSNGATFNGSSSIQLPDHNDFSAAGAASKALTIIAFQTVTDWKRQSANGEYVHWMGKGKAGAHEWTFRYYVDGGGGEAPSRPRRTSFYHFNPAGGLGAGSFFQDPDAAGVERVIGGMVWGNASNGGSTQMWKNGVVRDTDALSGYSITPQNTATPVFLGSRGDGTGFLVGRLRRIAFFNRKLTAAEMKKIYDARNLAEGGGGTVTPPVTPPVASNVVTINGKSLPLAGINVDRAANQLVAYTPAFGLKTTTNEWGFEVAIAENTIRALLLQSAMTGLRNLSIPVGGVVLSGHGTAKTWLQTNATLGATVTLPTGLVAG